MSLRHLFFSLDGRINRRQFWYGNLALAVAMVAFMSTMSGSMLIDARRALSDPIIAMQLVGLSTIAATALFVPWLAVVAKRFHDRGRSTILALALCVLSLSANVGTLVGLPMVSEGVNLAGALFAGISLSCLVWIYAEGGILAGDPGENQHGPAPQAGGSEAVVPASPETGLSPTLSRTPRIV